MIGTNFMSGNLHLLSIPVTCFHYINTLAALFLLLCRSLLQWMD